MTAFDKVAHRYWQDYLSGTAIAGGISYEPYLRKCTLDESMDSLKVLDKLLDHIKQDLEKKGNKEVALKDPAFRNFLLFVAFYAGRVVARQLKTAWTWIDFSTLCQRYNLAITDNKFFLTMAGVPVGREFAPPFFALNVLGAKFFGSFEKKFKNPITKTLMPESLYWGVIGYLDDLTINESLKEEVSDYQKLQKTQVQATPHQNSQSATTKVAQKTQALAPTPSTATKASTLASNTKAPTPAPRPASMPAPSAEGQHRIAKDKVDIQKPLAMRAESLTTQSSIAPPSKPLPKIPQPAINTAQTHPAAKPVLEPTAKTTDRNLGATTTATSQPSMQTTPSAKSTQAKTLASPASHTTDTKTDAIPAKPIANQGLSRRQREKLERQKNTYKAHFREIKEDLQTLSAVNSAHDESYQKAKTVLDKVYALTDGDEDKLAALNNKQQTTLAQVIGLLQRLSSIGNTNAKLSLALCYFEGIGVVKDPSLGVPFVEEAAKMGDVRAAKFLSRIYYHGLGVNPSSELGEIWLDKAALGGHLEAKRLKNQFEQIQLMKEDRLIEKQKDRRLYYVLIASAVVFVLAIFLSARYL